MGMALMRYPIFRSNILDADSFLLSTLGCEWSVLEELERDAHHNNTQLARFSQPLCAILQVALVDLLSSWNIRPTAVVGHSSGEIGAAYCYGALSREDAWKIAYWRGKLCSELTENNPELVGAMMAVGLSVEAVQPYLVDITQGKLVVACVNSPSSITISGDEPAVDELFTRLTTESVFCRKLKVENAYHSHHIQLIATSYRAAIAEITPKALSAESIHMLSSVTGTAVTYTDLGPDYWVKNLVSPVLFSDAVEAMLAGVVERPHKFEPAVDFMLEVGPHATLKSPLQQIMKARGVINVEYSPVIQRDEISTQVALNAAGRLYTQGAAVLVSAVNDVQSTPKPLLDLESQLQEYSLKLCPDSRVGKPPSSFKSLQLLESGGPTVASKPFQHDDQTDRACVNLEGKDHNTTVVQDSNGEFVVREWHLRNGEWVATSATYRTLSDDAKENHTEQIPISECPKYLKIKTGNPESPGSYYFAPDVEAARSMDVGDVEIEVKAIGLRWATSLTL